MAGLAIPYIDPNVEHVGMSRLRRLNSENLRKIEKTMVIQENDTPLAVLLRYEQFLIMQDQLRALLDTIDVLSSEEELSGLTAGLQDFHAGRTKNISDIRASLGKKRR